MGRTILVPLDGSDKDARALAVAADLGRLAGSSLTVIRVRDTSSRSALGESNSDMLRAIRTATERVGLTVPLGVTCEVVDADDVPGALRARADGTNALALVMATRAPQAIDRVIHGSVADRVVREATRPVVLVPPLADFMRGRELRLRRGLVPVDGSAMSLAVLSHVLAFPNVEQLELVLLQVVPADPGHDRAEAAERALNAVAARIRSRGAQAEVRVVEARDPAAVIAGAIRQDLVDFIAMTTRGASGAERMLFGSVATAVVRASEVPVLLVTPAAAIPWRDGQ